MNEIDLGDALSEISIYNPAEPKVIHLTLFSPVSSHFLHSSSIRQTSTHLQNSISITCMKPFF